MNLARVEVRAKVLLAVGFFAVALTADLVGLALLFLGLVGLLLASGLAHHHRTLAFAAAVALPFAALNAALVAGTTLASVDGLAFSREGLEAGLGFAARGVLAVGLGLWLAASAPGEVLQALRRWPRAAVALTGALRFAPAAAEDWHRVREAQALRGRAVAAGFRGTLGLGPVFVPLMVATVRRGRGLQEALEASAFGSGPRTQRPAPPLAARDVAVAGLGLALVALAAVAALRGGGWA